MLSDSLLTVSHGGMRDDSLFILVSEVFISFPLENRLVSSVTNIRKLCWQTEHISFI